MEAVAADTITLDKTGTLTKAGPQVADVVVFLMTWERKSCCALLPASRSISPLHG